MQKGAKAWPKVVRYTEDLPALAQGRSAASPETALLLTAGGIRSS